MSDMPVPVAEIRHLHWLLFNQAREVVGCQCGFRASESDCGWGDSVVAHLQAEALRAVASDPDGRLSGHSGVGVKWLRSQADELVAAT